MSWLVGGLWFALLAPPPSVAPEHFRYAVEFPHGEGGSGWLDVTIDPDAQHVRIATDGRTWVFDRAILDALRERWGASSFAPRWPSELCHGEEMVWRYEHGAEHRTWCRDERAVHAIAELNSLLQVLLQ